MDRIKILRTGRLEEKGINGRPRSLQGYNPFLMLGENELTYIQEGYEKNDDLYSVIDYVNTLAAGVEYAFIKSMPDGTEEEIEVPEFEKLLKEPQPGVTYKQFIKQAMGFRLLTGDGIIYGPKLENGVNKGKTTELLVLPTQYVKVKKANGDVLSNAKSYTFRYNGNELELAEEDVGHFMASTFDWTNNAELKGMSPLKAGLMRLSSSNDALLNKAMRFQNSGADGIVGTKNKDASIEDAGAMKDQYAEKYGGPTNAGKLVWTNLEVTYNRFGLSPVDLQTLESMKLDLQAFCRMYRLDAKLLDPNAPSAYASNMKEAKGSAYTMAVIPTLQELFDVLTMVFLPAYLKPGEVVRMQVKIGKIPELQKDLETLGKALKDLRWSLSLNEARNFLGLPPHEDPDADIPEGLKQDAGFNMPNQNNQ